MFNWPLNKKLFSVREEGIHLSLSRSLRWSDHYAVSEVNYGLWTVSILHSSKLFTISDSFNYGDMQKKKKKKNAPHVEAKRSTEFHFGARRNIARNNPPIHHCWSWQLKNNVRVSIVRTEPFIIELPEFQFAGLHISDSIRAIQLNVKSELTNYK